MESLRRVWKMVSDGLKNIRTSFSHLFWGLSSLFPSRTITLKTKQGIFRTSRNAYDPISTALFVRNNFELDLMYKYHEVAEKENFSTSGTILDIGANIGVICIGMLRNFGFERAIAIEAEPRNIELMKYNVKRNKLSDRVAVLHTAASNEKSFLEMELSTKNSGDHRIRIEESHGGNEDLLDESSRKTIKIPSDRVDSILADLEDDFTKEISLMWIDVQGFEGYVFNGAEKLLSRKIPTVSEIWPYGVKRAGMTKEEFCDIIMQVGWSHYWVERRGRFVKYPIELFSYYWDELDYGTNAGNVIFTP